jgi:hypothetical protein
MKCFADFSHTQMNRKITARLMVVSSMCKMRTWPGLNPPQAYGSFAAIGHNKITISWGLDRQRRVSLSVQVKRKIFRLQTMLLSIATSVAVVIARREFQRISFGEYRKVCVLSQKQNRNRTPLGRWQSIRNVVRICNSDPERFTLLETALARRRQACL